MLKLSLLAIAILAPVGALTEGTREIAPAVRDDYDIEIGCMAEYYGPTEVQRANTTVFELSPNPTAATTLAEVGPYDDLAPDFIEAPTRTRYFWVNGVLQKVVEDAQDEVNEDPSDKPNYDLAENPNDDVRGMLPEPRREPPRHAFRPRPKPDRVRP